jgi:hypothetical protein
MWRNGVAGLIVAGRVAGYGRLSSLRLTLVENVGDLFHLPSHISSVTMNDCGD